MTTRSMLLTLTLLVLSLCTAHGGDSRGDLISLRHRDHSVEYTPDPDELRTGYAGLGDGTSLYVMNTMPTNPLWSHLMGESAGLYRIRIDDPYQYDPNGVVMGLDRWFGSTLHVSANISSARGQEEDFLLRDQEQSVNEMVQIRATYLPDNGFFSAAYADVGRSYDVAPGQNTGKFSAQRFNRSDFLASSWNTGLLLGYGRTFLSSITVMAATGVAYMNSAEDYRLRLNSTEFNRFDTQSTTATTSIPLNLTIRYHRNLSEQSRILFETNVGMNHTLAVHDGTSRVRMSSNKKPDDGFEYTNRFSSMRNLFYAGAAIGYRRQRVAAWLRYDYHRQGDSALHKWTATLGWSF